MVSAPPLRGREARLGGIRFSCTLCCRRSPRSSAPRAARSALGGSCSRRRLYHQRNEEWRRALTLSMRQGLAAAQRNSAAATRRLRVAPPMPQAQTACLRAAGCHCRRVVRDLRRAEPLDACNCLHWMFCTGWPWSRSARRRGRSREAAVYRNIRRVQTGEEYRLPRCGRAAHVARALIETSVGERLKP